MSEQKTHAEIIAEMRGADNKCQLATKDGTGCYHCPFGSAASNCAFDNYADRLDLAHNREVDALKQRLAELNAEIAAKDEVIMRLNDAIAEEQRRQMATTEKSSVVGDAAKLPKTVDLRFDICQNIALVLKIGRDYQNKDGYRGAHYDIVKLLCDAIEYQQEQLETKTKVGNVAKLREAAVTVYDVLEKLRPFSLLLSDVGRKREFSHLVCLAKNRLDAALAAPARECDVGTAEEQSRRFCAFCRPRTEPCDGCACLEGSRKGRCEFVWAQMPCNESGTAK